MARSRHRAPIATAVSESRTSDGPIAITAWLAVKLSCISSWKPTRSCKLVRARLTSRQTSMFDFSRPLPHVVLCCGSR